MTCTEMRGAGKDFTDEDGTRRVGNVYMSGYAVTVPEGVWF